MADYIFIDDKEIKEVLQKKILKMKEKIESIKGGKSEKKFFTSISAVVLADVFKHFASEEGSEGPWKEWSQSYKKAIAGPKPPRQPGMILQDSGRLRQSFIPSNYSISDKGIYWFNNAKTKSGFPYAYAHNEGGGKLPKRDFMWLSDSALETIAKATLDYVEPDRE